MDQCNGIFSPKMCMKIEFISQRREMLLFLTTNTAAVTSRVNKHNTCTCKAMPNVTITTCAN